MALAINLPAIQQAIAARQAGIGNIALPTIYRTPEAAGIGGITPAPIDYSRSSLLKSNFGKSQAKYDQTIAGVKAAGATPYTFSTNKGNLAGVVAVTPETQIRIWDEKGKNKLLYTGTGVEGANEVQRLATQLSQTKGKKANWGVEVFDPSTNQWQRSAEDNPAKSVLGKIADIALPVLGAVLAPVTGGMSAALAAGLGAAAGSALSGVAQGRGIGDIAKGAAISGLGTFAGGSLLGNLGSGASNASNLAASINPGAITPGILTGEALSSSLANIGSTAALNAGLTSGLGAGFGSLGSAASGAGNALSNAALGDFINVVGPKGLGSLVSAGGSLGGGLVNIGRAIGGTPAVGGPEEILVTGAPKTPITVPTTPIVSGIGGATGVGEAAAGGPEEITVTGKPSNIATVGGIPIDVATGMAAAPSAVAGTTAVTPSKGVLGTGLTASQLLQLGGLGSSLIGGLIGGGSSGGGGALVPGGGAVTYTPLNRTQVGRTSTGYGFDPFTYGQAVGGQPGEYTFFETVPAAAAPAAAPTAPAVAKKDGGEIEDDHVKHLMEYHKNGGHEGPGPVKGVGSGQEDKIPAWLSDGEYVWSAQDVADLGDGSTNEGVRRLDRMRQMVRKQAGRKDVKKIAKPQKGIEHMVKAVGGRA